MGRDAAVRGGPWAVRVAAVLRHPSVASRRKVLNKKQLIDSVAGKTGESKRLVGDVIETALEQITSQVKKGERVQLPGFGTFERRARSARTARNPRTGEEIQVKATKVPAFKAGAQFKDAVSGR
jgi:DNA-binding protein HU-beta